MGVSWGLLGASWGGKLDFSVRGPPFGPLLGRSWGPLGAFLGCLEALLGRLGAFLGRLGALLGRLGGLLGRLGAVLGASWAVFERRKPEKARKPKTSKTNQ